VCVCVCVCVCMQEADRAAVAHGKAKILTSTQYE